MRRPRRFVRLFAIVIGILTSGAVWACKCFPDDWYLRNETRVQEMFDGADFIIHAKVVELIDSQNAKIEILETFKGASFHLDRVTASGGNDPCGASFRGGEEKIFISSMAPMNRCQMRTPNPALLELFRKYKR